MLRFVFDPRKPFRVVIYLRMSSDKQNPRSPVQQLDEIKKRLKKLGLTWKIVKIYRDNEISGRYFRKRHELQRMLGDIRDRRVVAELVLVDTKERFGRLDDLPVIRKELFEKCGVLILTADTDFCDPTTPQGRILSAYEDLRATEDGRIKAHNVSRGKRDLVERKFWPGGPAPFGMKLRTITETVQGRVVILGSVLEPDPATAWIIVLLFETARAKNYGQTRLAHFLNAHPDIPAEYKPFYPATVGDMTQNALYMGDFEFDAVSTGIVDDTRIQQPNAKEDRTFVRDYCPAIVSAELWQAVNDRIAARAAKLAAAKAAKASGQQSAIKAWAPGLSLNYPLSGLVRCHHCGRAMTASSGPSYTSKSGVTKRYTAYVCPGYIARICSNSRRVPEEWLRAIVLAALRARLGLSGN